MCCTFLRGIQCIGETTRDYVMYTAYSNLGCTQYRIRTTMDPGSDRSNDFHLIFPATWHRCMGFAKAAAFTKPMYPTKLRPSIKARVLTRYSKPSKLSQLSLLPGDAALWYRCWTWVGLDTQAGYYEKETCLNLNPGSCSNCLVVSLVIAGLIYLLCLVLFVGIVFDWFMFELLACFIVCSNGLLVGRLLFWFPQVVRLHCLSGCFYFLAVCSSGVVEGVRCLLFLVKKAQCIGIDDSSMLL